MHLWAVKGSQISYAQSVRLWAVLLRTATCHPGAAINTTLPPALGDNQSRLLCPLAWNLS